MLHIATGGSDAVALVRGLGYIIKPPLTESGTNTLYLHDLGFCAFLRSGHAAPVLVTLHWKGMVRNDCLRLRRTSVAASTVRGCRA